MRLELVLAGSLALASCTQLYMPQTPQYDHVGLEIKIVYSHKDTQVPIKLLPGEIDDGKKRTRNIISIIKYVNGIPFVFADPIKLSKFSTEGQAFVIQHDIVHLQENHIHNYSIGITQQERETDCKAAKFLRDIHYSESQMQNILNDVKNKLNMNRYLDLKRCLQKQ